MESKFCQTPVQVLGLGVDFILPLSQEQEQQPHQNIPEGHILEFLNQKSLIFFKSQTGLYGAHKNKVIHHILKFQNIRFHIGNAP